MGAILDFITGRGMTVAPFWRASGAVLALTLAAAFNFSEGAFNALYRLDARLIDQWQRLSGMDEPSGEVVVVGIDAEAIRSQGRWPWGRATLAELVEGVAAAEPRSITLDILLTEAGPYSDVNLMRRFRQNGPDVIAMRPSDPDRLLARALTIAPVALAVGGGTKEAIDELHPQAQCAEESLLKGDAARPYYVECLLFPLPQFEIEADGFALTYTGQDLDGVVRRASAFSAQPYMNEGQQDEVIYTSMSVAALTACDGQHPSCYSLDSEATFFDAGGWKGFSLKLARADGDGAAPRPSPMTPGFDLWLDFGALAALGKSGGKASGSEIVSAADVFGKDTEQLSRLKNRHVFIGLTRVGAIDQHTTPLSFESGVPGVLIQALAADNIVSGRVLWEPAWARDAVSLFLILMAGLAVIRFLATNAPTLTAIGAALIVAPIAVSWAAFEFGQTVIGGATPAIGAFLAFAPVLYGRISAIRGELASAREDRARDEERMDAARSIQLGSLPFAADFTEAGFETASICRPAQEVGGDFFELFQLSDGRLFAAVGDVSGKGLEASLVTALSKSISGAVTDRVDGPLGAAFREVSREFNRQAPKAWREEKGGFVTLVAARIDPQTGEAEFACAGCEPPTVVGADGALKPLSLPSVAPLGWIENADFETASLTLAPGDTIVMFTDGVTEAETPDGELFGQEKADEISASVTNGAARLLRVLEDAVLAHQAGGAPTDDTTILAVTWRGAS